MPRKACATKPIAASGRPIRWRFTFVRSASTAPFSVVTNPLRTAEMPIRKSLVPVAFADDLKEELSKLAPAMVLGEDEVPRVGWLVEGKFDLVDGGDPVGRFFLGTFGVGRSMLALHVRVTDVEQHRVIYEFDMAGGSSGQGQSRHASGRAAWAKRRRSICAMRLSGCCSFSAPIRTVTARAPPSPCARRTERSLGMGPLEDCGCQAGAAS